MTEKDLKQTKGVLVPVSELAIQEMQRQPNTLIKLTDTAYLVRTDYMAVLVTAEPDYSELIPAWDQAVKNGG